MDIDPVVLIIGFLLSAAVSVYIFRVTKRGGVENWKGYLNAETLGLPDSMRPFNFEHETPDRNPPSELVLSDEESTKHRIEPSASSTKDLNDASGWVMIGDDPE